MIECCANRIVGLATELGRAHEIGIVHGDHREPWTPEFQQVAARIYLETVPVQYALRVAGMFRQCSTKMLESDVPFEVKEDWSIVTSYLDAWSEAVADQLGICNKSALADDLILAPSTPGVYPYSTIAALVHSVGVARLRAAGETVLQLCRGDSLGRPQDRDVELVRALAEGQTVVDIATSVGCSRSTLHRELARLWKRLGVTDARAAILRGGQEGWL